MWLFNSRVVPWSVEESRRIKETLQFRREADAKGGERAGLVTSVTFDNRAGGRLWFLNRYSRFAGRGYGVTLAVLDGRRREVTRYVAREADYQTATHSWVLRDGVEIQFDPETGEVLRPTPFRERALPGFHEDPQLMLLIDRNPVDLSFRELRRIIDYLTIEGNPKVTKYAMRLLQPHRGYPGMPDRDQHRDPVCGLRRPGQPSRGGVEIDRVVLRLLSAGQLGQHDRRPRTAHSGGGGVASDCGDGRGVRLALRADALRRLRAFRRATSAGRRRRSHQ